MDWSRQSFFRIFSNRSKKAARYFARRQERKEAESEEIERIYAGYDFTLEITSTNKNNGLFEAEGNDFYGFSRIKGQVSRNYIQFRKTYKDEQKSALRQFEEADFIGNAIEIGDAMIVGGEYHPTLRKWHKYNGIWQINKNPDGNLALIGFLDPKPWTLKPLRIQVD